MFKEFWDAAKDFARTMLDYADYEYYKQLKEYYEDALKRQGKNNLDDCHLPKFILRILVANCKAKLENLDGNIVEGSCKKALEVIDATIEQLIQDGTHPKVEKIRNFDLICRNFVYCRTKTKIDHGRNIPCNISPKEVRRIHRSNVKTIIAFKRYVSKMREQDYPVDLVELVKTLRK